MRLINISDLILYIYLQVILDQPSTETRAEWVFTSIKIIIKTHVSVHAICEEVVSLIPGLVRFVKFYHETMLGSVLMLVNSFLTLAKKITFGANLVVKIVQSVKYVARVGFFYVFFDFFSDLFLNKNISTFTISTI